MNISKKQLHKTSYVFFLSKSVRKVKRKHTTSLLTLNHDKITQINTFFSKIAYQPTQLEKAKDMDW